MFVRQVTANWSTHIYKEAQASGMSMGSRCKRTEQTVRCMMCKESDECMCMFEGGGFASGESEVMDCASLYWGISSVYRFCASW